MPNSDHNSVAYMLVVSLDLIYWRLRIPLGLGTVCFFLTRKGSLSLFRMEQLCLGSHFL